MDTNLTGKKIAILATDGFEQAELLEPKKALEAAGAQTHVIAPEKTQTPGEIRGWNDTDWGESVSVDVTLSQAAASDYDGLLLPGGVMNPDKLRMEKKALDFIREFFMDGRPVAAICHGPWTLVEADLVRGRELTSWPSLQTDIRNAGGNWTDQQVVTDMGLVTSRNPGDIPAFNAKFIEELKEGAHNRERELQPA